jgi:hypothetical protein
MSKSKFEEFHVPFIKSLVFVAVVTVVSMAFVHFYFNKSFSYPSPSVIYASEKSQIQSK